MPQAIKRHQDIYLSSNEIPLKTSLKNKKLKNIIENFSNEIFYEIFDYLDGCDIYSSFSNLNIRFQNLLTSPLLLLKIEFSAESESLLEYRYKYFIDPNKHQIISLHFHDELLVDKFFTLYTFNSLFTRVESIVLHGILPLKLVILLFYFKSLSRLYSLTICLNYCDDYLGDIYRIIFQLSSLKYLKMDITQYEEEDLFIIAPLATEEQYSSIERLSISHCCSVYELTTILSYTPQLSHLYCMDITYSDNKIEDEVLRRLTNLVHFRLDTIDLDFDQFEEFIMKLSSHLRKLVFSTQSSDECYLDADRWERLIVQHMPCLIIFDFSYYDSIINDIKITQHHTLINRFTSSFWIKHQWFFDFTLETDEMLYRIRPYAKHLYDFHELKYYDKNSLIHYNPGVHMSIAKIGRPRSRPNEPYQIFIDKISPLFQMIDVTHLFINCDQMNYNVLIHILNLLPNLDLLRIRLPSSSSSSSEEFFVHGEDNKNLRRFLDNNKITRLILGNIYELEEISFIFNLFSRLKYFAMEIINIFDLESIVECTIRKIKESNNHPMTLCIIIYEEIHDELKKIQQIIDSNNLLKDYTINRRTNKFYIQWK